MQVPLVVSNHPDLEALAVDFGARFVHLPITAASRSEVEQAQLALLEEERIELVVLAKYMQVLSPAFLARFSQVINIHPSFLPAFQGAQPYHRAWERGVKLIGATAHFVTEELDGGPIIEQAFNPTARRMARLRMPSVAAVNGVAAGAGVGVGFGS
jgi:formyltetrahydrofolate deformylase